MCYVDGDMCLLVIMCALALIRTGAAAVAGDNEVAADNRNVIRDVCLHECVPRCQQLMRRKDTRCCNCISMCEKSCGTLFNTESNRLEVRTSSPQSLCTCDVQDVVGRRPSNLRRTRRRPSRSPMLREAAIIARSVGMDLGSLDSGSDNDVSDSVNKQVALRLVSLVQGDDSLTAVVSWDSSLPSGPSSGTPWYLVTWETQDGVRGNLLTNSTSASLSLWPDTVYHVQVSSTSSRATSASLEVDTHSAPPHVAQGVTQGTLWRVEVLGGVASAVLMFLFVLLASAMRCRRHTFSKHCGQSHENCDRYKLYPPPVTLRHTPVSTTMFTCTSTAERLTA